MFRKVYSLQNMFQFCFFEIPTLLESLDCHFLLRISHFESLGIILFCCVIGLANERIILAKGKLPTIHYDSAPRPGPKGPVLPTLDCKYRVIDFCSLDIQCIALHVLFCKNEFSYFVLPISMETCVFMFMIQQNALLKVT